MRRSILSRRKRLRIKKTFELPLTSMMDMLIIIVVFLLKSYSTSSVSFTTSSKIQLPISTSEAVPEDALNLVIEPSGILLDSQQVVAFSTPASSPTPNGIPNVKPSGYLLNAQDLGDQGRKILPLFDALEKSRENAELLMNKASWYQKDGDTKKSVRPEFKGVLTIQADKSVQYDLIRKIMYTAGSAKFKVFKFIAVKKEI